MSLSEETKEILKNLIEYQNLQLLKHISKVKGWSEKELIEKYLLDDKNNQKEKEERDIEIKEKEKGSSS